MDVDVGQIIAGKYELQRLLGKGAMGEVWLATHNSLGGEFAIKLVQPADDAEAETASGRFQLEAQIAAKLSRKTRHIVSVSDHGEENGLAYLVMERLEGESLEARLKRVGRLDLPEVVAIVMQIARALSLAHEEGIFHRDLKPANVWLGKDEDGCLLVKLLDFGIARTKQPFRTRSPFATSKDMVLGTPSYMSPEQARGLDSLDHRCDLWALAVVAYEALTRKIPFEGKTVEDIFLSICTFRAVPALARRPDLPPAIEGIFARAFAPALEDRFATALELTEAFERLVAPEEIEAALGGPLVPSSARRLVAARASDPSLARASDPSLARASDPSLSDPVGPASGSVTAAPDEALEPDHDGGPLDSMSIALGPSTTGRRFGSGALYAIAAVVALLSVGAFLWLQSRDGDATAHSLEPPPPVTTTPPVPNEPLDDATEPRATIDIELPEDPPSTPESEATPAAPKPRPARPQARATASAPERGPAEAAPRPAEKGAVRPATPTKPSKPINKAEIF